MSVCGGTPGQNGLATGTLSGPRLAFKIATAFRKKTHEASIGINGLPNKRLMYRRSNERIHAQCQFTTVLGVTKTRGLVHPDQNVLNAIQNSLCRVVNRWRGRCACRASSCRRRAVEDEILAGTASAEHPTEEMPERHDHSKNLIGTIRIQLFANSFILQVYDVLARRN